MFCTQCGLQGEEDWKFCLECGFQFPKRQKVANGHKAKPPKKAEPAEKAEDVQKAASGPLQLLSFVSSFFPAAQPQTTRPEPFKPAALPQTTRPEWRIGSESPTPQPVTRERSFDSYLDVNSDEESDDEAAKAAKEEAARQEAAKLEAARLEALKKADERDAKKERKAEKKAARKQAVKKDTEEEAAEDAHAREVAAKNAAAQKDAAKKAAEDAAVKAKQPKGKPKRSGKSNADKKPNTSWVNFIQAMRPEVAKGFPVAKGKTKEEQKEIFLGINRTLSEMWQARPQSEKDKFKSENYTPSGDSQAAKAETKETKQAKEVKEVKAEAKKAKKAEKAEKPKKPKKPKNEDEDEDDDEDEDQDEDEAKKANEDANKDKEDAKEANAQDKAEAAAAKAPPVETVVDAMLLVLRSTFDPRECECLKEPPELMSDLHAAAKQICHKLHERAGGWNSKQSRTVSLFSLKIAALDQKGLRAHYKAQFDKCTGEDYKFALGVWTRRFEGAPPGSTIKKYPNAAEVDLFLQRVETASSVPTPP